MLISHTHKFIFVHVPKTAGTSVMNMCLPNARLIDRLLYDGGTVSFLAKAFNRTFGLTERGNRHFAGFSKHEYARVIAEKLGPDRFSSYFSFAFVRNPYDWTVSRYLYIRQAKGHHLNKVVSQMSFESFVKLDVADYDYQQSDFVCDPEGKVMVNFVGRFENLDRDVHHIARAVNLKEPELRHANPSRARKGKSYQDYYCENTKRLIARKFERDLTLFGYTF